MQIVSFAYSGWNSFSSNVRWISHTVSQVCTVRTLLLTSLFFAALGSTVSGSSALAAPICTSSAPPEVDLNSLRLFNKELDRGLRSTLSTHEKLLFILGGEENYEALPFRSKGPFPLRFPDAIARDFDETGRDCLIITYQVETVPSCTAYSHFKQAVLVRSTSDPGEWTIKGDTPFSHQGWITESGFRRLAHLINGYPVRLKGTALSLVRKELF